MSPDFVAAAVTADFEETPMKEVEVNGREILVVRLEDGYVAVGNRCSYMGANLSYGKLEGNVIQCFAHGRRFDLRDGSPQGHGLGQLFGGHGLTTYETKLDGDRIMVSTTPRQAGEASP